MVTRQRPHLANFGPHKHHHNKQQKHKNDEPTLKDLLQDNLLPNKGRKTAQTLVVPVKKRFWSKGERASNLAEDKSALPIARRSSSSSSEKEIKCVIAGDGGVGKTCLLMSYACDSFPDSYTPTVFDNFSTNVKCGERPVHVGLWDTAGQDALESLRVMCYTNTDVLVLCFNLADRTSFENVRNKWVPELTKHAPSVPLVLVGTKADTRAKLCTRGGGVTTKEGRALANSINALRYVECSAATREGVMEVFDCAIRLSLGKYGKPRRRWCL